MIVRSSALLSALLFGSTMAGCSSPSGASRDQAQQPTAGDQGSTAEPAGLDGSLDAMTREIIDGLDAEKKTRIAVVGFTDESGAPSRFGLFLAEELTTRLFKAKRFTVIERGMLQKILDEQKLQVGTSLIDPKSAKEIGRILAVDALATGTYTLLGDRIKVNARLIGTQDGSVFAAAGGSMPCDATVASLVGGGCTMAVSTAGSRTAPPAPSAPKPGYVFNEDFAGVQDGYTPSDWTGGDKMQVESAGRSKVLVVSSKGRKIEDAILTPSIQFPEDFSVDVVFDLSECSTVDLTVGDLKIAAKDWNCSHAEISFWDQSCRSRKGPGKTFHLEKKGPVFTLDVDGQRCGMKRVPSFSTPRNIRVDVRAEHGEFALRRISVR